MLSLFYSVGGGGGEGVVLNLIWWLVHCALSVLFSGGVEGEGGSSQLDLVAGSLFSLCSIQWRGGRGVVLNLIWWLVHCALSVSLGFMAAIIFGAPSASLLQE